MIRREEICNIIQALLYYQKSGMVLDPEYRYQVRETVKRIRSGEPIANANDPLYESHGNGD